MYLADFMVFRSQLHSGQNLWFHLSGIYKVMKLDESAMNAINESIIE